MRRTDRVLAVAVGICGLLPVGGLAEVGVRVRARQPITSGVGGGPRLDVGDDFGESVSEIPDLNGDGIIDLVVGAEDDDDGGTNRGAVYILFLSVDGTVQSFRKISSTQGGFTGTLNTLDRFGQHVAWLGSLDGNGPPRLAVSSDGDDDGALNVGGVWILALNSDGSVQSHSKISATAGGFPLPLETGDAFGHCIESLGDLDGDGIGDIAIGAEGDDDGGTNHGAFYVTFLNADASVKAVTKIGSLSGGFGGTLDVDDQFSQSIARLGDLDGDGVTELAVGSEGDDDGGVDHGAVWILFLNSDGSVKSHAKISSTDGGFTGALDAGDLFGQSLARLDDMDGDGVPELAIGAEGDDDGDLDAGALWIVLLQADGTAKGHSKISTTSGNFGDAPGPHGNLGNATAYLGDLDGDGVVDVVSAADGSNSDRGVLHVLFLEIEGNGPLVQAGADQTIRLPQSSVALAGQVTNAGGGPWTTAWSGPAGVVFDDATALDATAALPGAGSYVLTLTVDVGSDSASDALTVVVEPPAALASITVTPPQATVAVGGSAGFAAEGRDQYGDVMAIVPQWEATGGTITSAGLYTAGASGGTFEVTATEDGIIGQALVTVSAVGGGGGPIAHWPFDEGSGSTTANAVTGDAARVLGPAWIAGVDGAALGFDGVNDRVDAGDILDFANGADFTIAAWVRVASIDPADQQTLVGKWTAVTTQRAYRLDVAEDGTLQAKVHGNVVAAGATPLAVDAWHHAAMTVGQSTGTVRVYLDGVEDGFLSGWAGNIPATTAPFVVGRRSDGQQPFDGDIDDVRV